MALSICSECQNPDLSDVEKCCPRCYLVLIENGVEVNAITKDGWTSC